MEGKTIVYIAGNPDLYPLEYYDAKTASFQGVLPGLYAQFSAESGYELVYYQPENADRRTQLAKNLQVDILSGYGPGDDLPEGVQPETVLQVTQGGETVAYTLGFTSVAPEGLREELTGFLQELPQQQVSGLLLTQAQQTQVSVPWAAVAVPTALAVLLAAALTVVIKWYRARLRRARDMLERDSVTGLGNAAYFEREYHYRTTGDSRILYQLVYFFVDTDRLRRLGTGAETDDFLQYCAQILREYVLPTDVMARVSDQGFVMLRLDPAGASPDNWLRPLLDRVRRYAVEHGKSYNISMTAAVYPLQQTDTDLVEIMSNISMAARLMARDGQGYVMCDDRVLRRLGEDKRLQQDIERAFENHEFRLYIQFYVDAQTSRIVGGEALSRWQHPRRGILTPGLFVPMMEREKQISRLDYYSLREACVFLEKLQLRGVQDFFLSCNFSRETLAAPDFVARSTEIIREYRFPRELLIFEITESAAGDDMALIAQNITALRAFGVRIALDDFGEGFTSFCDLQQYAVDGIKLDKTLVDIMLTGNGSVIVRAMIQVGHQLGLTILAEGVENDAQVQALREMHCDVIQGFRFYHPVPDWEARERIIEQFSD